MKEVIDKISEKTRPIKKFIDEDDTIEVLHPNKHTSDELITELQKVINYNNQVMTHKSQLEFLMSVLLESKLGLSTNTPDGAKRVKQINVALDYLDMLRLSIEDIRMKYKHIIDYYNRWSM